MKKSFEMLSLLYTDYKMHNPWPVKTRELSLLAVFSRKIVSPDTESAATTRPVDPARPDVAVPGVLAPLACRTRTRMHKVILLKVLRTRCGAHLG